MSETLDLDALAASVDAEGEEVVAQAPAETTEVVEATEAVVEATATDSGDRGAKITAARRDKLDKLFAGKKYEILKPVDLTNDPEGRKFETPLGNKGKKGYAIKLAEGYEPEAGWPSVMIFGESVLRQVEKDYGSVTMPEAAPTRTRRTKEQKEADEQAKLQARREAMEALAAELGI